MPHSHTQICTFAAEPKASFCRGAPSADWAVSAPSLTDIGWTTCYANHTVEVNGFPSSPLVFTPFTNMFAEPKQAAMKAHACNK
jgi:hypothetical protein